MISVIIPLMPIEPYRTQIDVCLDSINRQDAGVDIFVVRQRAGKYINKNLLLNAGIRDAKGKYIFLCDADFILDDTSILKRMQNKVDAGTDVIFPMFLSETYKKLKISDGGVFTTRKLLDKFGELDESLQGISWVTFPFLKWCLDNVRWHCSDEFIIEVDQSHKSRKKRHAKTSAKMRPIFKMVVQQLQKEGVWP
jgi:glycosyltransferase involved in cell wall biosynthesis